ncbi:MAG TPA: thioredoxin domain-containing protein [Chthonomonadaceae bacterium]|nr:thioredoxin domain-containing protein [Chthonomonadaceae bacterium]
MNRMDRAILSLFILLAAGMVLYVSNCIFKRYHPSAEKPEVLSVSQETVIGKHPLYRGNAQAPFVLVEFADYQCPACIAMHPRVLETLHRPKEQVKLLFHHFPLPMHPQAKPAAIEAEAARVQGQFWSLHDLLMNSNGHLLASDLQTYVQRLRLDPNRLRRDLSQAAPAAVESDLQLGKALGVNATPTFLLCTPARKVIKLGNLSQVEDYLGRQ